jgi:DNA modification methylase
MRRLRRGSFMEQTKAIPAVKRGTIAIADLVEAKYNPRKISDSALAGLEASIDRFGAVQEVVVNVRDGKNVVVGGHQKLRIYRKRGVTEAAAVFVDLSVKDEKALNIALNSPSIAGTFTDGLRTLLDELKESDDALFAELQFEGLNLDDLAGGGGGLGFGSLDPAFGDPEAIPPLPTDPITKRGDLWLLGDHRLLCGDSTNADDLATLLDGEHVALVVTDPPYGVGYGAMRKAMAGVKLQNDANADDASKVITNSLAALGEKPDAIFMCCDWRSLSTILNAFEANGLPPKCCIVWDKGSAAQHLDRFAKSHEFLVYSGPYGGQKTLSTDVWSIPREYRDDHPTPKPVELIERAITSASEPGNVVLDMFAGSGSTAIACEMNRRRARLLEIDPRYCDVVVTRWEKFTGKKAERAS